MILRLSLSVFRFFPFVHRTRPQLNRDKSGHGFPGRRLICRTMHGYRLIEHLGETISESHGIYQGVKASLASSQIDCLFFLRSSAPNAQETVVSITSELTAT